MSNLKHNKSAGFTLVEMLVAISIMVILTLVSVTNMRKGERQKKVAYAADGLVSALRLGQNYALSGKVLPDAATCANRSPVAYEVTFNRTTGRYSLAVEDYCNTSPVPVVENFALPDGTKFKSGSMSICNPGCNSSDTIVVRFTPPFAKMTAATSGSGTFGEFNTVNFTVQDSEAALERTVTVDGISGKIGE
ncbi:MAG: Tfp pilus assembly protein FimT/FimU [Candidatus Saccharibacteria bacterium]